MVFMIEPLEREIDLVMMNNKTLLSESCENRY